MEQKNYLRKIVPGFFGNIFSKIVENIPGIAHKVAPIAIDASKAFATGATSAAGTAVGQKIADKIKVQIIAPTKDTKQAMTATTKKLLSPQAENVIRKLVKKTRPNFDIPVF